jgi:hypothetical protein
MVSDFSAKLELGDVNLYNISELFAVKPDPNLAPKSLIE